MCLIGCLDVANCSLRFYTNLVLSSLCAMINVTLSTGFVFFAQMARVYLRSRFCSNAFNVVYGSHGVTSFKIIYTLLYYEMIFFHFT